MTSQVFECGFDVTELEELEEIPYPDCTLESYDEKCIRVKINFLNVSPRPLNSPSDAYFFDLLTKINGELADGKIRLTFDDNCIYRGNLTSITLKTQISTLIGQNDPDVDDDPNAINLYFIQGSLIGAPFGSFIGKHLVIDEIFNFHDLIHEIGHLLSLKHTFRGTPEANALAQINDFMCKDITVIEPVSMDLMCEKPDDGLCDTGIDPITLTLDGDGYQDGYKWVDFETCTQDESLTPDILDFCDDATTPWNIPIDNYMSYYQHCRNRFTPCQFGQMHEMIEEFNPEVLINCEEDPYDIQLIACSDPDIIVNSVEEWQDDLIEMCPGQRIVITSTGHLILDNTTITWVEQEVPNEVCPNLFFEHLWSGIHITGRGVQTSYNGNSYILGGITLTNGSLIEYSKHGISAQQGYGRITINSSSMRQNGSLVSAFDPWPLTYSASEGILPPLSSLSDFSNGSNLCGYSIFYPYPEVGIKNSELEVGSPDALLDGLSETQVRVNGGHLKMSNTHILNPNAVANMDEITAIKQGRGRLEVTNGSTIENFATGIFKAMDVYNNCSERGLWLRNTNILDTETALYSTTQLTHISGSLIQGDVYSEGLNYAYIYGNTFEKGLPISSSQESGIFTIQAPKQSFLLEENLFDNYRLYFNGPNMMSYSRCNTWQEMDEGYAVVGEEFVDFPESWGNEEVSAGNRHLDGEDLPSMFSEDPIVNYYDNQDAEEDFNYEYPFEGEESSGQDECTYEIYPDTKVLYDSLFTSILIDYNDKEQTWVLLDSIRRAKRNLVLTSSPDVQQTLYEQINQIEMEMGSIVREVLSSMSTSEESIETSWISRADAGITSFSNLYAFWYGRDFNRLDSLLSMESDPDAQALLEATTFLESVQTRGIPMDSLPESELDTLTSMATQSYGDYTNIIRNYLNLQYDRELIWPYEDELIPRSYEPEKKHLPVRSPNLFVIQPNPINECFLISDTRGSDSNLFVELFDALGSAVFTDLVRMNAAICPPYLRQGTYYIRITEQKTGQTETQMILMLD